MTIAVVFLLRANKDNKSEYIFQFNRFIDSLKANYVKEIENKFYIILKGDSKEYIKKKINKEKFLKINILNVRTKHLMLVHISIFIIILKINSQDIFFLIVIRKLMGRIGMVFYRKK